jgi:AraC-like DNA-binding protein
MGADLFFLTIDIANALCAALVGAAVLIAAPRRGSARMIALLCAVAIAHVILGRYDYGRWIAPPYRLDVRAWEPALNMVRNAAPGLFMLLAHRMFSDRRQAPAWAFGLFAVQMLLEVLPEDAGLSRVLTQDLPALLQLLLAALALYWTLGNWRADLVDARRRARLVMAVILGLDVVASSLLLRMVIAPNTMANYRAHLVLALVNLGITVFLLLRLKGGAGFLLELPRPRPAAPPREDAEVARLLALMEETRIWRMPGLTLKMLADRMGLPEYRLRALIHEKLGHRNFNAFLHAYRIAEARTLLADPERRRTPILTIALSVGYSSVNTFNRGFREVMGMAPSDWRENPAPKSS